MAIFSCPKGHRIEAADRETVRCEPCNLVATNLNRATGEVMTWTPEEEFQADNERLQDAMDAAFDNQYFGDGW